MYDARVSIVLISNHVGSGSEAHCLDGEYLTAFTTSSTVTILKDNNPGECPFINIGSSADAVAAVMSSIFLSMKSW